MLSRIDLRHFKCFAGLKLPLCPLTLLSGANASGKSSVIQALALMHQTMREDEEATRLILNGATVQLGTVADVVDQVHGHQDCEIGLLDDGREYRWAFEGDRRDVSMAVKRVVIDYAEEIEPQQLRCLLSDSSRFSSLSERLRGLTYLSAERSDPDECHILDVSRDAPVVGSRGEHLVSVLHAGREVRVLDALTLGDRPPTPLSQVEARMETFFPGCELTLGQSPTPTP